MLWKSGIPLTLPLFRNVPSQVAVLASDYFISNSRSRKERRVPILRVREDCDNTRNVSVEKYVFQYGIRLLGSLEHSRKLQAHSQAV